MTPLVLVVDDDPDILDAISEILTGEGYRVARARHGLEALDKVAAERPSLILLDVMMPVMDGVAFVQALRKRRPDVQAPIVVISAGASAQPATEVGAAAFLAKPFDIDALLAQVAGLARTAPAAQAAPA